MVLHNEKLIYFHVPKTAGYSMEQFLSPKKRDYRIFDPSLVFGLHNGLMTQHITYEGILKYGYLDEDIMDSYFKFAFFRNTWDRLCSAFFYLEKQYINSFGNFENCIKYACDKVKNEKYPVGWHFSKQTDFLFKNQKSKELALNFIGKYENIDEDFKELCIKINRPNGVLPKMNKRKRQWGSYHSHYSKELECLVKEAYAEEIEFFNYKFES